MSRFAPGLVEGTTYHYRLTVTTDAGTAEGEDVEFTAVDPFLPPSSPPVTPVGQPPPAVVVPTPTPIVRKPPLRCKKGFQKKRVRGKLKCVKRKRHPTPRRAQRGN